MKSSPKKSAHRAASSRISAATPTQLKALNAVVKVLPLDSKESDAALTASLKQKGQLTPIVRRRGRVVDGHRRVRLLKKLKKTPWFVDADLAPIARQLDRDEEATVLGATFLEINGNRRELNVAVRATMANTLAAFKKGHNQHAHPDGMSQSEAANTLNVSVDTMQRTELIQKTDKKLFAKVLRGEMSIPQAVRTIEAKALAKKAAAFVDESQDITASIARLVAEGTRFSFIYTDNPWPYDDNEAAPTYSGHPRRYYGTMTMDAIRSLPVESIAAKDSVIWMWTPNSLVDEAIEIMKLWGFKYVTLAHWIKRRAPQSRCHFRPYTETLIVGKRGQGLSFIGQGGKNYYDGPVPTREHSRKPEYFAEQAEKLFPQVGKAKVDLFHRGPGRPGWTSLGNQAKEDAVPRAAKAKKSTK